MNAKNNKGETPLHVVTSSDIAQLLIANGADVNATNERGYTPLHVVTTPEIVQLLVVNGADVNAKNNHGETPLHWSAFFGLVAKVNALLRFGADAESHDDHNRTPLDLANDHSQEVVELIEKFKSDSLK